MIIKRLSSKHKEQAIIRGPPSDVFTSNFGRVDISIYFLKRKIVGELSLFRGSITVLIGFRIISCLPWPCFGNFGQDSAFIVVKCWPWAP